MLLLQNLPSTIGSNKPSMMDSIMSLGRPLKQFTSFMTGGNATTNRGSKRSQSVRRSSFTRRKSISRRRSLPCGGQKVPDSWLRAYQADLKRERWGGGFYFITMLLPCYYLCLFASSLRETALVVFRHLARQASLMRLRMSLACRLLGHVSPLMLPSLSALCNRKRQQALLAKKNADRSVRKTHFRSHHCLPRVNSLF